MAQIFLTGATGFLGSRLAGALARDGHRIIALKRSSSVTSRLELLADRITWFNVEREGVGALDAVLEGVDAVIHTAANYGRGGETPSRLVATNTSLPLALLEAALSRGVPLFINTDTALPPTTSPYALSKRQFADWMLRLAEGASARLVNVRLEHFYGPGDNPTKFTAWIVRQCTANVGVIPLTEGGQERDFVYIDDVVAAYLTLLDRAALLPGGWVPFDLGSGRAVTVRQFAETVHRLTGSRSRLAFGAIGYRPHEPMRSCADVAALRHLGWQPRIDLEEGLIRTITKEREQ